MTIYNILHYPHVLLKMKSTDVTNFSSDLKLFVENMIETMYAFEGIGLAAPQVGILKRIIIVDVKPYLERPELKAWHGSIEMTLEGEKVDITFPVALVNPKIVFTEGEITFPFDGCLSLPGLERGLTNRYKKIEVEAYSVNQEKIKITAEGIMSICLQHELDHLEGIVFIERAVKPIPKDLVIEEIKAFESEPDVRKRLKKLKAIDARKQKFLFL
jgi:peptide deformylase